MLCYAFISIQALEAIKKVLDLSSYKRIDVLILDKMMCKLEQCSPDTALSPFGNKCEANNSTDNAASNNSESHLNNPIEQRELDFLLDSLGTILQQVHTIFNTVVYFFEEVVVKFCINGSFFFVFIFVFR